MTRPRLLARTLWLCLATVGCATPMAAMRDDNHRLSQSVDELRADRRAQDRKLRDLEHQLALAKAAGAPATPVPALPVEVVTPVAGEQLGDGQRLVGVTDDGSEIIYEGDAAAGKAAVLDDTMVAAATAPAPRRAPTASLAAPPAALAPLPAVGPGDRIEVTHRVPPVSAARGSRVHVRDAQPSLVPAAAPAGDADAPAADYRAAVELVKTGKYDDALVALRAFLAHYPRHDYADNAQYWLGEAYYAQHDYQHALGEFRATIETYPRGNKVPDALLKVGYCYRALGQADKARAVLEQVVTLYPRTEPAALAAKRLEAP